MRRPGIHRVRRERRRKLEGAFLCYNLACDQFTISYWRFMGGKGGKRHYSMQSHTKRALYANLQTPVATLVSRKPSSCIQLHRGDVVQLVRMLPCHGRGRGFEPRRPRHIPKELRRMWLQNRRNEKVHP
jgi:hypothetical protein